MQNLMIYNGRNLLTYGRSITPSEVLQMLDDITLEDINNVKKKFVIIVGILLLMLLVKNKCKPVDVCAE